MTEGVLITSIICATLIIYALINKWEKKHK